jgi:hypothetical protein
VFQKEQHCVRLLSHYSAMRVSELTKKELCSVDCPICGVASGHRCLLQSGGLRNEPHTERKLIAAEAVTKRKRDPK